MYTSRGSELGSTWNRQLLRTVITIGLIALVVSLAGGDASANTVGPNATEIDHCTEIEESGEYVLAEDVQPATPENLTLETDAYPHSACIAVNATGVVIDGQGYEINGTAAHENGSGQYYGVRVQNLSAAAGTDEASELSVRITNVTLTNWSRGVYGYNADEPYVNASTIRSDLPGQDSGVYLKYSDNATIHNNHIDGQAKGIELDGASTDVNVTHNEITNTSIAGIDAQGDRLLVANNTVEQFGGSVGASGIQLDEAEDARVLDNWVVDGYRAITAHGGPADDVTIRNNTLRSGEKAIMFEDAGIIDTAPSSANVLIRNNTVENYADGISFLQDSASPTVVDNAFANVTNRAIHVFDGSDHGRVESNVVTGSGIGLRLDGDHTTVEDNDFSGNDRAIDVRRSNDSTIRRNDLSDSDTVGVYALGLNPGTVFANNTITDGNGTGVEITVLNDDASDVVFERNEITRNQGVGVLVDNENAPYEVGPRNPVIRGNNISANGAEGIFDGDGVNATYADNRVANNAERGIYVRDYARNATVRNNTVVDNGGAGIQLGQDPSGGTPNTTVAHNTLSNNTDHAIVIEEESPGVVVANNSMTDHATDLRLHQVSGVVVRDNTFATGIAFGVEDDEDYVHDLTGNEFHDGSPLYYAAGNAAPNVPQDAKQVIVVDSDGLALSDLDVTTGAVPTGVLVATSDGTTIENVSVTGSAQTGVRIVSATNATLGNVTVDGVARGIALDSTPGLVLRNTTVTNLDGPTSDDGVGVEIADANGATIEHVAVTNVSDVGIAVDRADSLTLGPANVEKTGDTGIDVLDSSGVTVSAAVVTDAARFGIQLQQSDASTIDGVQVSDSGTDDAGVRIQDSNEAVVRDSTVERIGGSGIATIEVSNVTIRRNEAKHSDVGIHVSAVSGGGDANAIVVDNTITDNDRGLDGEQVQNFSENTVTDTANESATFANSDGLDVANNFVQRNGVGLSFDSLDDVTVRDNVLDDNDVGISDYYSQNLTIVSNQFSNHPTQGVVLEFADGFEIRDNDFVQNQPDSMYGVAAGARLEISSGDSGTVIGNEFDDNDDALQVVAQDSSSNLLGTPIDVRHNNFTSNAVGLVVYDETDRLTIRDNSFEGSIETAVEYSVSNPANYLNATQNWWGNVTGPSGNESDPVTGTLADGDGDAVGANVMFDPWLGSVPDGGEDGGSGGGDDGSGGNDGDSDGSGAGDGGSGGGGTAPAPTPAPTPEPTVVLEETDGGVSVTVGGAQAGTPVVISLDGAAKTGELELATIAVTTTEAVDFVATVDVQAEPPEASEALPTDVTEIAYFEVDAELTDDQIEEGTFEFTMTTEALADRGLEPEDVVLYHSVDGEWVERGTTVVEEREDAVDFRAQAPHFSWFVVGGVQSTGSEPDDGESDGSDATGGDETGDDETEDDGTESEETAPEAEENKADQGSGSGDESDDGSPGFGLGAAVVALIGVALLAVRRRA